MFFTSSPYVVRRIFVLVFHKTHFILFSYSCSGMKWNMRTSHTDNNLSLGAVILSGSGSCARVPRSGDSSYSHHAGSVTGWISGGSAFPGREGIPPPQQLSAWLTRGMRGCGSGATARLPTRRGQSRGSGRKPAAVPVPAWPARPWPPRASPCSGSSRAAAAAENPDR